MGELEVVEGGETVIGVYCMRVEFIFNFNLNVHKTNKQKNT